ncbi:MAG: 4Fe-4S binding protein [Candidatus Moranbacteria bacterium]|nr:4Fe-4S binding protein [Candidatus Moranbacteria bacterium]
MKNIFTLRRISQAVVLGIVLFLTIGHMRYGIEKAASIDAYCPFGAIEGFLTYVTTGQYLQRIYTSVFILMGIVVVLTFVFGRVFCSHLCPLGAVQEWIRGLGRKIGIKKDLELPKSVDKYARYLKYVILIVIVYFSYKTGDLIFRGYDPFNALMHLGEEFDEKVVGYSILGVVLFVSLFSKSWWCRYFCPFGATMGIIRKISPFKIKRNETSCIACGKCDKSCPAGLDISNVKEVNSADCISCLNCVKNCPNSSLKATTFGKEISKKTFSLIVFAAFFVPLGIFMLTPAWQVKSPSNIVTSSGELDASNLRGSNTLQYLLDTTKISFSVFQEKLGLPANVDKTMKLKDIGPKYDIKNAEGAFIETEDFRAVIESQK